MIKAGLRVHCEHDGEQRTYTLEDSLGEGHFSRVFAVKDDPTVVVRCGKIEEDPLATAPEVRSLKERIDELRKRLDAELDLIKKLRGNDGRFAPRIKPAEWYEPGKMDEADRQIPVYIMQRVGGGEQDDQWLLAKQLRKQRQESDWMAAEELAVQAGVQYAEMLRRLHRIEYVCGDRKPADIRWHAQEHKLYVIDWNVVAPDRTQARQRGDIGLFGNLWVELLFGRSLEQSMKEDDWMSVTSGLQRLLRYTLDITTPAGPKNAEELLTSWQEYGHWLEQASDSDKHHDLLDLAKGWKNDDKPLPSWCPSRWEAIRYVRDLLHRHDSFLVGTIDEWMQEKDDDFHKKLDDARRSVSRGNYTGDIGASRVFDSLWSVRDYSDEQRLLASRWYVVSQLLGHFSKAQPNHRDFGSLDLVEPLKSLIKALTDRDWTQATDRIADVRGKLDTIPKQRQSSHLVDRTSSFLPTFQTSDNHVDDMATATGLLDYLEWDCTCFSCLDIASRPDKTAQERIEAHEKAEKALRELTQKNPAHADRVRAVAQFLPSETVRRLWVRVKQDEENQRVKEQIESGLKAISQELSKTSLTWPGIESHIPHVERREESIELLRKIDEVLRRGMSQETLVWAAALRNRLKRELGLIGINATEFLESLDSAVGSLALQRLKDALDQKPYWPRNVSEAYQFGETLKNTPCFYEGDYRQRIDESIEKLGKIRDKQVAWGKTEGLQSPEQAWVNFDKSETDKILDEARDAEIELFDPPSTRHHRSAVVSPQPRRASNTSSAEMRQSPSTFPAPDTHFNPPSTSFLESRGVSVSNLIALRNRAKLHRAAQKLPANVHELASVLEEILLDSIRVYQRRVEAERILAQAFIANQQPDSSVNIPHDTEPENSEAPVAAAIPSATTPTGAVEEKAAEAAAGSVSKSDGDSSTASPESPSVGNADPAPASPAATEPETVKHADAETEQAANQGAGAPPKQITPVKSRWTLSLRSMVKRRWIPMSLVALIVLGATGVVWGMGFNLQSLISLLISPTATPTKTSTPLDKYTDTPAPVVQTIDFDVLSLSGAADEPIAIAVRAEPFSISGIPVKFEVTPSDAGTFDPAEAVLTQGRATTKFVPSQSAAGTTVSIKAKAGNEFKTIQMTVRPLLPRLELTIDLEMQVTQVKPGDQVGYRVTVRNLGPTIVKDVNVTCEVSSGRLSFHSSGWTNETNENEWHGITFPGTDYRSGTNMPVITLIHTIPSAVAAQTQYRIECQAFVVSMKDPVTAQGPEIDVIPLRVEIWDLTITPPEAAVGEEVMVTVVVAADGKLAANTAVTLTFSMDKGGSPITQTVTTDGEGKLEYRYVPTKEQVGLVSIIVQYLDGKGTDSVRVFPAAVIWSTTPVNVRSEPDGSSDRVFWGQPGDRCRITGKNWDASWLHIFCTKDNQVGWVSKTVARVEGDLTTTPIE